MWPTKQMRFVISGNNLPRNFQHKLLCDIKQSSKSASYLSVPFIGDAGNLNFFSAHFYDGHNLQSCRCDLINFLLTFYGFDLIFNNKNFVCWRLSGAALWLKTTLLFYGYKVTVLTFDTIKNQDAFSSLPPQIIHQFNGKSSELAFSCSMRPIWFDYFM